MDVSVDVSATVLLEIVGVPETGRVLKTVTLQSSSQLGIPVVPV